MLTLKKPRVWCGLMKTMGERKAGRGSLYQQLLWFFPSVSQSIKWDHSNPAFGIAWSRYLGRYQCIVCSKSFRLFYCCSLGLVTQGCVHGISRIQGGKEELEQGKNDHCQPYQLLPLPRCWETARNSWGPEHHLTWIFNISF